MRAVETILRARLLQKVNILKLRTVVYCYKEPRLKILRKERSNRRLLLLGSIGRIPELFDKNLNKEPSSLALFTALERTRYWGVIREWVYLLLQTVK